MMLKSLPPIDKISLGLISAFTIVIGGLMITDTFCGTNCFLSRGPKVRNFSWENKTVGAKDQAFILTFDRPMDTKSVETNLVIDPPLPGKFSWAGRRMAYTLETAVPYGQTYQVQLSEARERFRKQGESGNIMQPFLGEFQSRNRALA
ncbi:MAG TPA: hypothetical protein DCF68_12500, partial [Cyanothece sp. UBA12306]|nr:hypothetical protein [Cyanothece sp. UBA12306]